MAAAVSWVQEQFTLYLPIAKDHDLDDTDRAEVRRMWREELAAAGGSPASHREPSSITRMDAPHPMNAAWDVVAARGLAERRSPASDRSTEKSC